MEIEERIPEPRVEETGGSEEGVEVEEVDSTDPSSALSLTPAHTPLQQPAPNNRGQTQL